MAQAMERESQRFVDMVRSIASAAFMHSSQRKGSCTKRNFGKCCQSGLLTANMTMTVVRPQAESSFQGTRADDGACFTCRKYETTTAPRSAAISINATVDTRRLKRL